MAQQRGRGDARPAARRSPRAEGRPRPTRRAVDVSRLREVAAGTVEAAGYDLEGLSVKRVGRRHLVRVTVDGDGGVDLDRAAELARQISARLDAVEEAGRELVPGEYELEVSSPGVDRPLTLPRHWRRSRGRLVEVRIGQRTVRGRVSAADDDGVTLDIDGASRWFSYRDLGQGRVQVEFSRPGEPLDDFDDLGDLDGADGIDDEGDDEE